MNRSLSSVGVLWSLLALAGCGGGGGGDGGVAGAGTGGESPVAIGPPVAPPPPSPPGRPPAAPPGALDPGPIPTVVGTTGPDTLQDTRHPAVMAGLQGDDVYLVEDPSDVVIELPDEGVDEVRTRVGYTLPANVENMSVSFSNLVGGSNALVGNAMDNRITGAAFTQADIAGLEGNDTLDGGGRYGGNLDGGPGDDRLVNNIGTSRGGPGADTFAASPRGGNTAPDVPLTVLDFNPGEGDRIDGSFLSGGDPATLFASGHLQFDALRQRLVYTLDPARWLVQPSAVEQVILLPGLASFDPAWITPP